MADWAVHIFREHNREADAWAGNGVIISREEEWIDTANMLWSEDKPLWVFGTAPVNEESPSGDYDADLHSPLGGPQSTRSADQCRAKKKVRRRHGRLCHADD